MSPNCITVAIRNLPSDCTKFHIKRSLGTLVTNNRCDIDIGPISSVKNAYNSSNIDSRCTTATITGSKCETLVRILKGYYVSSNTDSRPISVDEQFIGPTTLAETEAPKVDVYFLHGLGGHAFHTWSSDLTKNNVPTHTAWPRDFLPDAFTRAGIQAQVTTIGYNANVRKNVDVTATLRSTAENLLAQLIAVRPENSEASRRHFYIVCHSLGGLVICQLLVMLFSERFGEDLPQRSKNVFFRGSESLLKGLVFLGTPFEGSLMANNFLPLIRAVDRINPFPMNRDLISQLRHVKNADGDLSFLSKEASIIFSQNKIEILIGCENAPYFSIGSALVTSRQSAIGIFGDRTAPITLTGSHTEIVKYPDSSDNNYKQIESTFIQMIKKQSFPDSQHMEGGNNEQENFSAPLPRTLPRSATHSEGINITIYNTTASTASGNGPRRDPRFESSQGTYLSQRPPPGPPSRNNTEPMPIQSHGQQEKINDETAFSMLGMFDTVFILDDTASMQESAVTSSAVGQTKWQRLEETMKYLVPKAIEHDEDGIDIFFLKSVTKLKRKVKQVTLVDMVLAEVRRLLPTPACQGGTRFFKELDRAIDPKMIEYRNYFESRKRGIETERPKPLNVILITDGIASDREPVEEYIINVADELDEMKAMRTQIGIQFVQIGDNLEASEWLKHLDDELTSEENIKRRDMVDTTRYEGNEEAYGSQELFQKLLVKILLGAVKRSVDKEDIEIPANLRSPVDGS